MEHRAAWQQPYPAGSIQVLASSSISVLNGVTEADRSGVVRRYEAELVYCGLDDEVLAPGECCDHMEFRPIEDGLPRSVRSLMSNALGAIVVGWRSWNGEPVL